MFTICDTKLCTGCGACENICAKQALSMKYDEYGFLHPAVDDDKCVSCMACVTVCPNNTEIPKNYPSKSFVCHAKNVEEQLSSTSGGIASMIVRYLINHKGVAYGCAMNAIGTARHIRITDICEIDKLKGSKYVQSEVGDTYSLVRKDLREGRSIVYVGTPCQIAGLRSFLKTDYENLLTIDFICHGVPSPLYFQEEIKCLVQKKQSIDDISFRNKEKQKDGSYKSVYGIFVKEKSGNVLVNQKFPFNRYIVAFIENLFYRESCYTCNYASPERVSDFTLGDYDFKDTPVDRLPEAEKIISLMTINTEKGKKIFNLIKDDICAEELNYDTIVTRKNQLRHPSIKHHNTPVFMELYKNRGYIVAIEKTIKQDLRRWRKNHILSRILNIGVVSYLYKLVKK